MNVYIKKKKILVTDIIGCSYRLPVLQVIVTWF